jgi:magnesium chelatase family protein
VPAFARTFTLLGVDAREVRVEVDVRPGLPTFSLVGLPDAAVRESRERVRAALSNSGFEFPQQRIIASLAPADLRKAGPAFDLAIAAALIRASGQLEGADLDNVALAGELALDGTIRPVPGVLAMAQSAAASGADSIVVPLANAPEAGLVRGPRIVPLERLDQLALVGTLEEPQAPPPLALGLNGAGPELPDLADLRGQPGLRWALEVAAAGGHSLLMTGVPGAGKSMAARRLPSILPPLRPSEAIEVLRIASACGRPAAAPSLGRRPFRAPHHTISSAGLVGGGTPPRPGEVTLAHRGVLFLDELAEFSRDALEALRQPVEDGRVVLTRARHTVELPCGFMLVAAANPCPCGHGEDSPECVCGPAQLRRYSTRLSGALADRVDLSLTVDRPTAEAMSGPSGEASAAVRERVMVARERQEDRLGAGRSNADMTPAETRRHARLDRQAELELMQGHERLRLSGRGHDRVLRVARTVADLDGSTRVLSEHLTSGLGLRSRHAA